MVTPVKKKVRRKVTKAAPKKAPAEQKAKEKPSGDALIASAIKKMQVANEMAMKALREEIKNINLSSPAPPVEWIFDIVRDETGLIRQIKARVPGEKLH